MMEQLAQLLEYGFMGLALGLAWMAFRLLRAEQGNKETPPERLKLIKLYLYGVPILAVVSGGFATLEILIEPKPWVIQGEVVKEGSSDHSQVQVELIPPPPTTVSHPTGWYRLENVKLPKADVWPNLQFQAPGYISDYIQIQEAAITMDSKHHYIRLEPITLVRDPEGVTP